ncbi:MAG: hypothetical protein ACYDH1_20700 [Anaerolineaceae bacterium]
MNGHHVIEDLIYLKNNHIVQDPNFTKGIEVLINLIKNAQHFFLGCFQEFFPLLENVFDDKSRVFFGPCAEHVRLPYNVCWFEFENIVQDIPITEDVPKRGILVKEMDKDLIWVWTVNCSKIYKRWVVSPQQYFITIGKTISEHEMMRELVTSSLKKSGASESVIHSYYEANIWPIPMINGMDVKMSQGLLKDDYRDLVAMNAALMLLNCKNIVSEDNLPPEKLNKKRNKNGKQELFTYKTLKLVLPTESKNNGKEYLPSGAKVRIHLCRGHFKNYTKESPLFGRYTGLYWWEPHIRGDKNEGIVIKDYKITTTSETKN